MTLFLEGSALTRPLNYLRVRHPYRFRYNFLYPALAAALLLAIVVFWRPQIMLWTQTGLISRFSQYLGVLAPFYLASLSAVATFSGPTNFDADFKMSRPVTLIVAGERGYPERVTITPRHFLSLLFGYCCVVSAGLFLVSLLAPALVDVSAMGISGSSERSSLMGRGMAGVFFFLLFQILISTMLGVYYLADKMHRRRGVLPRIDIDEDLHN